MQVIRVLRLLKLMRLLKSSRRGPAKAAKVVQDVCVCSGNARVVEAIGSHTRTSTRALSSSASFSKPTRVYLIQFLPSGWWGQLHSFTTIGSTSGSYCGALEWLVARIIHKLEIPMAIPYQQIALARFLLVAQLHPPSLCTE